MNSDFFDIVETDFDTEKKNFIDHMNRLKSMSVEEQTFWKKFVEVKSYKKYASNADVVKSKIWLPTDFNDERKTIREIESMTPTLKYVESKQDNMDWLMLRVFCHTMDFSQSPGRFLKFLVTDGNDDSPKYLGAVSIASDVISISDRDNYIGWSLDDRLKGNKRINNTCIGSCIMSCQPFGYNFLGGKLVACLITTDYIRNIWKKLYDDVLVGMTTTSLYGSYSMYNSLKWWHKCGSSKGKISIKPDDDVYKYWHNWLKDKKPKEYEEMMTQKEGVGGPVTAAKQRVINAIFKELGMKTADFVHGYERGVYYSPFYENTKDFLCNKIKENDLKLKELFVLDKGGVLDWWKPKAIERYKKLKTDCNLKPQLLYYNRMIDMDYEESKRQYFSEVGR